MDEIAGLARLGRECLLSGDHDGLRRALDRNFNAEPASLSARPQTHLA